MMNFHLTSHTLEKMAGRTTKLLTLELDLQTLAEFSAAAEVFGSRSKSTFLNQYVVTKIREAKEIVSKDEFAEKVAKHLEMIQVRSERKSLERRKIEGKATFPGETVIEVNQTKRIGVSSEAAGTNDNKKK